MLFSRAGQSLFLIATLAVSPAFASHDHRAPTAGHSKHRKLHLGLKHSSGQRMIDTDRATEIQQALIRDKYLDGAPSGKWDTDTQAAMQKYQSDHGWQTKLMPDSRALISLGLGPNHTTDLPATRTANGAAPASSQSTDQATDTLASVHSITQ